MFQHHQRPACPSRRRRRYCHSPSTTNDGGVHRVLHAPLCHSQCRHPASTFSVNRLERQGNALGSACTLVSRAPRPMSTTNDKEVREALPRPSQVSTLQSHPAIRYQPPTTKRGGRACCTLVAPQSDRALPFATNGTSGVHPEDGSYAFSSRSTPRLRPAVCYQQTSMSVVHPASPCPSRLRNCTLLVAVNYQ